MVESEQELKNLLRRIKEKSEKAGLKVSLNNNNNKIMTFCPITSWQTEWEKVEAVTDFIFLGSKFTVDGDCSHEIKRCLFLERKTVTNLGSVLKSRDIIMSTKVHIAKAMVFPAVMFRCDHKEGRMPKI